jgi:hypothetical protein
MVLSIVPLRKPFLESLVCLGAIAPLGKWLRLFWWHGERRQVVINVSAKEKKAMEEQKTWRACAGSIVYVIRKQKFHARTFDRQNSTHFHYEAHLEDHVTAYVSMEL